ncbi:DUF916 domain-containing protein [Agreia pratensis]|uniref:WxL protein peptidoglycan domain-containing protein n=1 Tax=Agreia pratensis TaxID=150121 RepID=UPI00188B3B43|nr:DUF916 domain-containing protein [Agreia pratensis]MBF4635802.1 DUF916 domain-containing protein [Agreia pratensis]
MISSTRGRRTASWLLAAAALMFGLATASPASAATGVRTDANPITWSVQPATSTGPDGRSRVEHTLKPGGTALEHLAVSNLSNQQVTFALSAADGYLTDDGRFNMLPTTQQSVDSGRWISIAPTVTVQPRQTQTIPFTVTVPANAEPGDHAAGVAASVLGTSQNGDGSSVTVDSRIGLRVLTRVDGALAPAATVESLSTSFKQSWNPFTPGSVHVTFTVHNSGNTRLIIEGRVHAGTQTSPLEPAGSPQVELLPGDRRQFSVEIPEVYPTFSVPVTVQVEPQIPSSEQTAVSPVQNTPSVWAPPYSLISMVTVVLILVIAVRLTVRARRRKVLSLLRSAREEGRLDAQRSDSRS